MKFIIQGIGAATVLTIVIVLAVILWGFAENERIQGQIAEDTCIASSSRIVVGNQSSVQVLATSSNRAYAKIQQPDLASNTVFMRTSGGTAATLTTGTHMLEKQSATGTDKIFEVGKKTMFPYTSAITAITDVGSTSVLVTDCVY